MFRIIVGLFLILFEFSLGADGHVIGLLPDFIGYLLLFFGMKAEQDKCRHFKQDKKFMIPFAVYAYAIYLANLYAQLSKLNDYVQILSAVVSISMVIYTVYILVKNFEFIENSYSVKIGSKRLMYILRVMAMCYFLAYGAQIIGIPSLILYLAGFASQIVIFVYATQAAIVYSEFKRNNRL